ncbi:MAG: pantoate--beta-alanine ligase [Spirochaetes bacterium]|nr:pantoate--beta-alanine ligase [Spirochaetota bacterium]
MQIIESIGEARSIIKRLKNQNKTIGFVPTMGALHEGHLSLIKKSKKENDNTIVSIFVNPLQFGPNEDFKKYPRTLEIDTKLAKEAGADIVFTPSADEIITDNPLTYVDINELSDNLCGAKRPGHFRGVCTIVSKLFNIIMPDSAYFGKKDIQQFYIIKKMTNDLNFDIRIVPCPIIREKDGLAMSSRNNYLTVKERNDALILSKALKKGVKLFESKETFSEIIIKELKEFIKTVKNADIDYVKIVDENMKNVKIINRGNILALAVYIGKTRLIDNHIFGEKVCF